MNRNQMLLIGGAVSMLMLLCCCCLIVFVFALPMEDLPNERDEGSGQPPTVVSNESETSEEENESQPVSAEQESEQDLLSVESSDTEDEVIENQTWLIMLYLNADDQLLEKDIFIDLNEAEYIGSTDRVHIVAQVDRFDGGFSGDGDWTSTKRFYLNRDTNLNRLASSEVQDLGEVMMSDQDALVDFMTWAAQSYPADKHVLIMSDHGMGWPGGWSDPAPGGLGRHDIALADWLGEDMLFLMELDQALSKARAQAGIDKLELIGFDACLMSFLEVFTAVTPHARYAVASQALEPGLGWAYSGFLGQLVNDPDMSGAQLATAIVDTYIDQDIRVTNDEARAEFIDDVYGFWNLIFDFNEGPEELADLLGSDITLTAVDLRAIPNVLTGLNGFANTLQTINQEQVAESRVYAQTFQAVFEEEPSSYLDLGHFAELVTRESGNSQVAEANKLLQASLQEAYVAERHGPDRSGATGMSIYFPDSELYGASHSGYDSYTTVASRFASNSLWDDFLLYHYTGHSFELEEPQIIATPPAKSDIRAPGATKIEMTPLTLSSESVTIDEQVIIQTEVSGEQIANIFLFVGYYDEASDSILVADIDYIEAFASKEVNGVHYPDWEAEGNPIYIELEWEPILFHLNDGVSSELALFYPEEYGASAEEAIYSTDGIYTFADSGERRFAQIFSNATGQILEIYGFTNEDGTGSPHQITPQLGDEFTILQSWIPLSEEEADQDFIEEEGATLVFGEQEWQMEEVIAPIGEYVVGFIAENIAGESYEEFEIISVE